MVCSHTFEGFQMIDYVRSLRCSRMGRRAVTAIEYALIAALIAIVIVSSVAAIGTKLIVPFTIISTTLSG